LEAPQGRRDDFIDPYFKRAKPNEVIAILRAREPGRILVANGNRKDDRWYLQITEVDGQPGAAGVLCIHEGVALFGGSATVPELRRRGLQSALLEERMHYAFDHGCDLAMMVAEAGSNSQRNAERKDFQIFLAITTLTNLGAQCHYRGGVTGRGLRC
jgi:GNAT superfamily N-acetyltransferase